MVIIGNVTSLFGQTKSFVFDSMSLVEIRKLRKKIRQIECLEQLGRDLTVDEVLKVLRCNHTCGCNSRMPQYNSQVKSNQ